MSITVVSPFHTEQVLFDIVTRAGDVIEYNGPMEVEIFRHGAFEVWNFKSAAYYGQITFRRSIRGIDHMEIWKTGVTKNGKKDEVGYIISKVARPREFTVKFDAKELTMPCESGHICV